MTATTKPLEGAVYLASRYSRYAEMQGVRDVLQAVCGVKVTSRWIDQHGGAAPTSCTPEALNNSPADCAIYALVDCDDLLAADTVISFTGGGGKGGRHVEFGMGLAWGRRCIVVGPREHVFHTHPAVEWFPTWSHLVMAVSPA